MIVAMMLQSLMFWNPAVLTCCFMGLVTFMPAKKTKPKAKGGDKRVTGKSKHNAADKSDSEEDNTIAQAKILKPNFVCMFVL
jgi:hypothetical protein